MARRVRRAARSRAMKALRPPESLKLTSMMDILTVLLLFLSARVLENKKWR